MFLSERQIETSKQNDKIIISWNVRFSYTLLLSKLSSSPRDSVTISFADGFMAQKLG